MASKVEQRVQSLEALCGELYQILGTVGAPARILDKVAAAAAGRPIPDIDLLPVAETDFSEVRTRQQAIDDVAALLAPRRAAIIGATGGSRSTESKRAASRINGRRGGRPAKGDRTTRA